MRFGLTEEQIEQIQTIMTKFPEIREAIIFGSRAMGNYREASDVDIALKGDTTFSLAAKVKYELEEETYLPFFFDVLPYEKSTHAKLKTHIDQHGICFYRSSWKECTLGDVAKVQTGPFGSQLHASDYVEFGVPVIMPKNIGQRLNINLDQIVYITEKDAARLQKYRVKPNNIVFSRRGDVEKCAFITDSMNGWLCGTGGLKVSFQSANVLPRFMAYYFSTSESKHWLTSHAVGTTMPNLNSKILRNFPISLPPLPEQKAIAAVLQSLDDKIDLLHRQNKTLEAMAQALFRRWFVDEISETKLGYLGDLIETTLGGEWGKEETQGDFTKVVNCIRGTDIGDLQVGLPNKCPARFVKEKKYERIKLIEGDLIVEISGGTERQSTGRTTYISDELMELFDLPLVFSNFCRLFRPKNPSYMYFIYSYIMYLYEQGDFFNLQNGTSGIRNLDYKGFLYSYSIDMPINDDGIIEFYIKVKPFFKKINRNKRQIQTLGKLRDTLLPKLMSGEVKVKF